MPSRSEPFPEAEVRRWGRFSGAPTDEQLSRFFLIGPGDLERVDRARSEVTLDPPARKRPIIVRRPIGELPLATWPIMKRIIGSPVMSTR